MKLNSKKGSKFMVSNLVLVVIIGCSTVNNTNNEIKIADNKISKKLEPKKLTFSSKAVISTFTDTFKLPEGKHEKIELSTDNVNGNFKIKIPNNSEFKVIFKKSNSFKIVDNDATDGLAIVNMPEDIMDGYIKLQDQSQSNSSDKLTIEDKLYYSKQDLSVLSSSEKDKWYKLGSKPFPVPNDWHNDDGNDYILRFNNSGIKKAEMRWFKNDKTDYPNGIKEVGIEGGTVELSGIGKIEIPEGALTQKTTVVLKQELESKEIIVRTMKGHEFVEDDPASPLLRIEPMGLKLNKQALVYIETDKARLGNNHPRSLYILMSKDKNEWIFGKIFNIDDIPLNLLTDKEPSGIEEFSYIGKFINKSTLPDSGMKFYESEPYIEDENIDNSFNIQNTTPIQQKVHFLLDKTIPINSRTETQQRAESAYKTFYNATLINLKPCDGEKLYQISMKPSSNVESTNVVAQVVNRKDQNGKCSYLEFNEIYKDQIPFIIEHELWHSFQHSKSELDSYMNDKYSWVIESTASYMGAKAYKKYSKATTNDKSQYIPYLTEGVSNISLPLFSKVNNNTLDYSWWGFFNSIANKHGDGSMMLVFNDFYPNTSNSITNPNSNSQYLSLFHNYAIDSYMNNRFLYNHTYNIPTDNHYLTKENHIKMEKIKNTIQSGKPIIISKNDIDNFSAKYFKLDTTDLSLKNTKLSIKLTSISEGLKVTPLVFVKSKSSLIEKISLEKDKEYVLTDENSKTETFKENISYVIFVASYSNLKSISSKGAFSLQVGYGCPKSPKSDNVCACPSK